MDCELQASRKCPLPPREWAAGAVQQQNWLRGRRRNPSTQFACQIFGAALSPRGEGTPKALSNDRALLARPRHRVYSKVRLPSSSGLGRGPLKAETGVRFP